MSKLNFAVYPAVALLSLAAAFPALAEPKRDLYDQAGYGATVVETTSATPVATVSKAAAPSTPVAAPAVSRFSFAALFANRSAPLRDVVDQAGYGATVPNLASTRTRAEVRAEAIAAREAGYDAQYHEGADPQYAVLQRVRAVDTAHVVAGAPAKQAAQ